jgi:hypothetical protein
VTVNSRENLLLRNKRPVSKPWEKGRVSDRITAMSRFNLISFGRYMDKYNSEEIKGLFEAKAMSVTPLEDNSYFMSF